MKFFFVTSDMPYPGYTGASVVNWSIINFLVERGHQVTLFADPPKSENVINKDIAKLMYQKIKKVNCNFISLDNIKKRLIKKNILTKIFSNDFKDYFSECNYSDEIELIIKDQIKKHKPDIILCYGSPAIHFVRNIDIYKAGWCNSVISYTNLNYLPRNFKDLIDLIKSKISYLKAIQFQKKLIKEFNNVDKRFQHSKDFALELVKRGAKSCDHILPPFFEPSKISVNEKILNRSYSKIIVVGLLSTVNKFQIDVLRNYVFPEIEKNLDLEKIQFHFIGANQDDLPEDFKKKKYIIGRGYVNDLSFEIKDSDIFFCVTPKPLGFRTRICEALSLGACILTSKYDQASIPFLEDKNNCYIVDNINDTGKKLINILNKKNDNENIRNNARKAYEEHFSYDKGGRKFEKYLTSSVNYK